MSTPADNDDACIIEVSTHADIVIARQTGRDLATSAGFRPVDCSQIATAISELARNITLYAGTGRVVLRRLQEPNRIGVQVEAIDEGPGIADPELAMRDGYSTSHGLGLGLPGTRRLMDDFELHTAVGRGTTIRVRKWRRC